MTIERWFALIPFLFLTGTILAMLLRGSPAWSNRLGHGIAALACLWVGGLAWHVLEQAGGISVGVGSWGNMGVVFFRVDYLSAFFLLLLGIVGAAVSIYAIGYTADHYGRHYCLQPMLYNVFLCSLFLVLTVSHGGAFLIFWELMALSSFFLILTDHTQAATGRAAFIYLVMTHVGTAFLIAAFLMMGTAAGAFDFRLFTKMVLSEAQRNLLFLFALIGFGVKAGIMPMHIWLPKAHPAAPSHVSALLSAVMLKTAVYGFCRFYLDFLGSGPTWWGIVLMVLGGISAFLGVLYALMENDIKKMLAYSSLENMGVILLAIGAGMTFSAAGKPLLAGLAWGAALFHACNHAVFKALLFMAAGAVVRATGTKDLEAMGGLIHRMPVTAVAFLAGSVAVSSLPPFNGFVSEWMILQSLFFLPQGLPGLGGKLLGGLLFVAVGMVAALVAACFVKAFGIAFLARARTRKVDAATEATATMKGPMIGLAALCLLIGVWPHWLLKTLSKTLVSLTGTESGGLFGMYQAGITFVADDAVGILSVPLLILFLGLGFVLAWFLFRLKGQPRQDIRPIWACGIHATPKNQYSATGFAKPVRWAFRWILRTQKESVLDGNANLYAGRKLTYYQSIRYILDETIYRSVQRRILKHAQFVKQLQAGSVQLYVGYVLIVTIVVLAWSTRN